MKIVPPLRDHLHLNLHPQPLGHAGQLQGGLPRFFKGGLAGAHPVAVQAHGDLGRSGHEMLQNRQVLPGEIREAVDVECMLLGIVPLLQLFQQPGHLIPGVPLAPAAQGIIPLHQQGQLLQLLGQAALRLQGGMLQILSADAAALEFIHGVHQLQQEFRLGLHRGIGLQPAGQLPGRRRHGHHPSAVIQALHGAAARLFGGSSGKAGEGQYLGIPAGSIPGRLAEQPLGFVADELRHHQNSAGFPFFHIPGNAPKHRPPVFRPVRANEKPQHGKVPPFVF